MPSKKNWCDLIKPFTKRWLSEQFAYSYHSFVAITNDAERLQKFFNDNKLRNDRLKEITGYDVSEIDFGK